MNTLQIEDPPGSRLFIVCGRSVEEDTLKAAFQPYGNVQNIKLIKEKGVCYVKFDKASSAALAIEALNGAVLNNGRGPKLKVLLAEAPTPRGAQGPPKEELSRYPDLEYCKTDLIASKGVVFVKYSKASSALMALEEIATKGMARAGPGLDPPPSTKLLSASAWLNEGRGALVAVGGARGLMAGD
eukprot:gene1542-1881_t